MCLAISNNLLPVVYDAPKRIFFLLSFLLRTRYTHHTHSPYSLTIGRFRSAKKRRRHFLSTLHPLSTEIFATLLSCCLTSTEARWPIRDGDRVGRGRECERLDRGNRPKKTGETVDRRQNKGSAKAVSPRHCPAICALRNCCFNCCAGQSH